MKLKFTRIILLLTILQLNILTVSEVQAQFEKESKSVLEEFFRTTLDLLYLNGEEYGMNESPMFLLKGYRNVYPQVPIVEISFAPGGPIVDKNYKITWAVIDNSLYLCDLDFSDFGTEEKINNIFFKNEQYKIMEDFTHIHFRLLWIFTKIGTPLSPVGVIPAYWMNGVLYVKEMITSYSDDDVYFQWLSKPCKRLVFRRGKLVSMNEVSGVDPNEKLWKREFSE